MTDQTKQTPTKKTKPLDIVPFEEAVEQEQQVEHQKFTDDMRLKLDFGGSKQRLLDLHDGDEIVIGRNFRPGERDQTDRVDLAPYFATEFGVSRRHVAIKRSATQLFVIDLDSTNGTYLNHARIKPQEPVMISDDDLLRLGLFEITVRFIG